MTGGASTFASQDSTFSSQLAQEIREALVERAAHGHPAVGDPRLRTKAIGIAGAFLASYAALLMANSMVLAIAAAAVQGGAAACLGMGVFHDAGHGTFSPRRHINRLIEQLCCVALGPSRFFWRYKHLRLHHRKPNRYEWDDDIDARGWLRMTPQEPWRRRYRGQQWRAPLVYALNTFEWFFVKDLRCLVRGRLNRWHRVRLDRGDLAEFWISKLLWLVLFVVPPFVLLPLPTALVALAIYHFVFSLGLAIVFQLAHLSPAMAFAAPFPDDHASHQMCTTANFATGSRLVTFLTGGLNHQIEHHLFPGVAHTHYRELSGLVKSTARRHGLPYHDLGSFPSAIRQHFSFLRALGAGPEG